MPSRLRTGVSAAEDASTTGRLPPVGGAWNLTLDHERASQLPRKACSPVAQDAAEGLYRLVAAAYKTPSRAVFKTYTGPRLTAVPQLVGVRPHRFPLAVVRCRRVWP